MYDGQNPVFFVEINDKFVLDRMWQDFDVNKGSIVNL